MFYIYDGVVASSVKSAVAPEAAAATGNGRSAELQALLQRHDLKLQAAVLFYLANQSKKEDSPLMSDGEKFAPQFAFSGGDE